MLHQRLGLLLLSLLIISGSVTIASRYGRGETSMAPIGRRVKVLRRKDQLGIKPTKEEIAAFQDDIQERKLKIKTFKDMPLEVREVRKLQSDSWYKDLEIEVKNVSTKPIYYILASLYFPDVPAPGNGVWGISYHFGFNDNIDVARIADPQDPHVDPGKTLVLTIPEYFRKGLKGRYERSPEAYKKFEFRFNVISFGDGTGFELERLGDYRRKNQHPPQKNHHSNRIKRSMSVRSPPQDGCGSCGRYIISGNHYPTCYSPTDNCPADHVTTSPERPCTGVRGKFFECPGAAAECVSDEIYDAPYCPGYTPTPEPTPTPASSPTPSPTPSPAPTCDPNTKPNNTNCQCVDAGGGTVDWFCGCADGSDPANQKGPYATSGGCDPAKSINNGADCCTCVETNHTCPRSNCNWSNRFCECVDNFLGGPCSAATPTPTPGGGGGPGDGGPPGGGSCTEYWWVMYECSTENGRALPQEYFIRVAYASEEPASGPTSESCVEVGRWYAGCW